MARRARPCALVVDGSAALGEDLDSGRAVVPVRITVGDAEFIDDGSAESYTNFYQRLRGGDVAHTSTPSPGEYLAAFRRCDAERIICLTIPAEWSGMHAAATVAAGMLAAEEGEQRVTIVDSRSAAVGLALTARVGADLCARGQPAGAVVDGIRRASATVRMFGTLSTLTYVARSGRVPALVAGISNTLHIRPVFRMEGTETGRVALTRTTSGALDALEKAAVESIGRVPHWVLVFHADAPAEAAALGERLDAAVHPGRCESVALSPIAGAYTGPGAFGFAAMPLTAAAA